MSPITARRTPEERRLLGDLLLEAGLLSRDGLRSALDEQGRAGGRLGWHLLRLGRVAPAAFHSFLDAHLEAMRPDLVEDLRRGEASGRIPADLAHHYGMVPVRETREGVLELAVSNADQPRLRPAVEALTGLRVEPIICPPALISEGLARHYPEEIEPGVIFRAAGDNVLALGAESGDEGDAGLEGLDERAAASAWLRAILAAALTGDARRIDLEPHASHVDLVLTGREGRHSPNTLPGGAYPGIAALLEGLARITSRGRILPREGRFAVDARGRRTVVSVLALPGLAGRSYTLDLRDEVTVGTTPAELAVTLPHLKAVVDDLVGAERGLLILAVPGPSEWASALDTVLAVVGDRLPCRAVRGSWDEPLADPDPDRPHADLFVEASPWTAGDGAGLIAAARRGLVVATVDAPDAFVAAAAIQCRIAGSGARRSPLRGILAVRHLETLCPSCRLPWDPPDLTLPSTLSALPVGPLWTAPGCSGCRGSGRLEVTRVGEFLPLEAGDFGPQRRDARRLREEQVRRGLPTLAGAALRAAASGRLETREVLRILLHEPH